MKKRSILITGCSSGIGLCCAEALQQRGHQVIASCRKPEDVERLQQQGLTCLQLDLEDSDSIQLAVKHSLEMCNGKLDAVFNNGAYGIPGAVEDLTRDALRTQFETNLFGWQELTNALIPSMRQHGFGRIIHNSSVLGLVAFPYRGAYVASKFALEGLSDTLRMELRGTGIDISLIEPGPIRSKFRENAEKAFLQHVDAEHSLHKNQYRAMQERLQKEGDATSFTLPPEAVLACVQHALESERPKPRYYVTKPTWIFGIGRRFLSTRTLDRLLIKASGGGKR